MRRLIPSLAAILWFAASMAQGQYDQEPRQFEPSPRSAYLGTPGSNAAGGLEFDPVDPPIPSRGMPARYDVPIDAPTDSPIDAPRETVAPATTRRAAFQKGLESPAPESPAPESPLAESSVTESSRNEPPESKRYVVEPAALEPSETVSADSARLSPARPRAERQTSLTPGPPAELATPVSSRPVNSAPVSSASTSSAENALALPPAGARTPALELPEPGGENSTPQGKRGVPSIASVIGSLAVVLGLLMLVAWALKRAMPKAASSLPPGVVEVLGRAALAPRNHAHLIRVGNKLLLVSVTPAGAETLTEITDPLEVDRLAGMCMQAQPNSSSQAFRQVFQQFSRPPTETSFIEVRRRERRPMGGSDA